MELTFERTNYPDGQISAKWTDCLPDIEMDYVKQRINSYSDLMFVKSIADVLEYKGVVGTTCLFIPYLFGSRSDKRFTENQSLDLRQIADVINSCKFGRVEILDPHSDVSLYAVNRSRKISSLDYVSKARTDIVGKMCYDGFSPTQGDLILVSPDAGAYKKVFEFGEKINLPVVAAVKHRDLDGNISMVLTYPVQNKTCLIVDDLCDGGATFIALGNRLKELGARKVYLYVTHGLFSKGFKPLLQSIDHVYCTNSISDLNQRDLGRDQGAIDYVTQYKVI